jgi:hypothetical protein
MLLLLVVGIQATERRHDIRNKSQENPEIG